MTEVFAGYRDMRFEDPTSIWIYAKLPGQMLSELAAKIEEPRISYNIDKNDPGCEEAKPREGNLHALGASDEGCQIRDEFVGTIVWPPKRWDDRQMRRCIECVATLIETRHPLLEILNALTNRRRRHYSQKIEIFQYGKSAYRVMWQS